MRSGICEVGSSEKRGRRAEKKREEGTEKGYKREGNGLVPEGRDGREKGRPPGERREERREKREERDKHDQDERVEGRNGSVPEGRDGREKGRALGETREERKEKREDPCRNNEQLNCNCTATGFALSRVEQQREKREERREKRSQKRPPEIPNLTDSRVCWPLGRLESLHFCRVGGLEAS